MAPNVDGGRHVRREVGVFGPSGSDGRLGTLSANVHDLVVLGLEPHPVRAARPSGDGGVAVEYSDLLLSESPLLAGALVGVTVRLHIRHPVAVVVDAVGIASARVARRLVVGARTAFVSANAVLARRARLSIAVRIALAGAVVVAAATRVAIGVLGIAEPRRRTSRVGRAKVSLAEAATAVSARRTRRRRLCTASVGDCLPGPVVTVGALDRAAVHAGVEVALFRVRLTGRLGQVLFEIWAKVTAFPFASGGIIGQAAVVTNLSVPDDLHLVCRRILPPARFGFKVTIEYLNQSLYHGRFFEIFFPIGLQRSVIGN